MLKRKRAESWSSRGSVTDSNGWSRANLPNLNSNSNPYFSPLVDRPEPPSISREKHPFADMYCNTGSGILPIRNISVDFGNEEHPTDRFIDFITENYTLLDAMEFRKMTLERINTPPPKNDCSQTSPLTFSTAIPSNPFAIYQIVESFGTSHIVMPLFIEIAATDRPDLLEMKINHRARLIDLDTGLSERVDVCDLRRGDTIIVIDVCGNPKKLENPWQLAFHVTEFALLPRKIKHNRLIQAFQRHRTKYSCVVEGIQNVAIFNKKPFPAVNPKPGHKIFNGSVMIPYVHKTGHLNSARDKHAFFNACKDVPQVPKLHGCILTVENLEPEFQETIQNILRHHATPNNNDVLFRVTAFASEAADTLENGGRDPRVYSTSIIDPKIAQDGSVSALLYVSYTGDKPKQMLWMSSKPGDITLPDQTKIDVTIVGATFDDNLPEMWVQIEINEHQAKKLPKENINVSVLLNQKLDESFLPIVNTLRNHQPPKGSRGQRIIESLFAGPKISSDTAEICRSTREEGRHTEEQCKFIDAVVNTGCDAIMGGSCFGGGKSTVLVSAARHIKERKYGETVLLLSKANAGISNLCQIAAKTWMNNGIVRLISADNRKTIETAHLTDNDITLLIRRYVLKLINNRDRLEHFAFDKDLSSLLTLIEFGESYKWISRGTRFPRFIRDRLRRRIPKFTSVVNAFLQLTEPRVLASTISTAAAFFTNPILQSRAEKIAMILLDESSQVSLPEFMAIATAFPNARIATMGDRRQFPPVVPEHASHLIESLGCVGIMNVVTNHAAFPIISFWDSFRCPLDITTELSSLYYENRLQWKKIENGRIRLPEYIWPNGHVESSIRFIDNDSLQTQVGSSLKNEEEADVIKGLVAGLIFCNASIAVLSFYRAQFLHLKKVFREQQRDPRLFLGTVEASQGREFDIVIIATTRTQGSMLEFHRQDERVNVAISRTKDKCLVVGKREFLKKASCWRSIMDASERGQLECSRRYRIGSESWSEESTHSDI